METPPAEFAEFLWKLQFAIVIEYDQIAPPVESA